MNGNSAISQGLSKAGKQIAMTQEYEQKLSRACLAALARRAGTALVVTDEEIEREHANDARVACERDAIAKCVRITVPAARS